MSAAPAAPRAFISYSWSSPTHQSWVINLATRLREDGIDVILDKWDLLPGHDSIAFMEKMVTDASVTKVIMICDSIYAEKADGRSGGVGTESQIISPEIYGHTQQNKFAAVITEAASDGKANVPTFYKGRIYFDFSSPERESSSYEELLRWLADRPLHVKPKLGSVPAFIADGRPATTATASRATRVEGAVRTGSPNAAGLFREYADAFVAELPTFAVDKQAFPEFDDGVVDAVERFRPYAKQYQEVMGAVARYGADPRLVEAIASLLERAAAFMYRPPEVTSWSGWDFDQYKIIVRDLFISTIAVSLKEQNFDLAATLTNRPYLIKSDRPIDGAQRVTSRFTDFAQYAESITHRNRRLNLNRINLESDFFAQWYKGSTLSFDEMMQADFVLFLVSSFAPNGNQHWDRWYPVTLAWAARRFSPFDIFARAESASYFLRLNGLLGGKSLSEFKTAVSEIEQNNPLRFDYRSVSVSRMANIDQLGTVP